MTTNSSSWLNASMLPAHYHLVAAVGIVASLSAAVGAAVTVRVMRARGGNDRDRNSCCTSHESEIANASRPRYHNDNSNGSQVDSFDQAAPVTVAAGPMDKDCPSALECHDSSEHRREEEDGEENANYPCCECSCSACSSCTAKAGGDTADEFSPDKVFKRRRRYAQNRESAFGDCISNKRNNGVEESMIGSDGGDAHLDYAPQTTTHASKMSQHHAMKVKMYISETELQFKGEEEFDELITSAAKDSDRLLLLRRTRAVSALANRLMNAPDEANCLEEVTRLMILMFDLEKVTFAMLTGSDHFYMKRLIAKSRKDMRSSSTSVSSSASFYDFDLYCLDSDDKRPLEGTAAGVCAKTLKEHYTPQTRCSPFATHKVLYKKGYNTVLVTPILVNGNKWAGCILLSNQAEDAFTKSERVIISDIGLLLGSNIYAKRLLKEADESKKRSREMLHSFIPPKVLQKIECYWDSNSEEYKQSRQHTRDGSCYSSTSTPPSDSEKTEGRTNSWYVAETEWPEPKHYDDTGNRMKSENRRGVEKRIAFLRKLNSGNSDGEDDTMGVILKRSETELLPSTRALYAESVKDGK